jgi:putative addiction module CopG family antidote
MSVEQMNISLSPRMAKFIRGKVKTGSYTNISEVVRAAVRRMQEDEAREAKWARKSADDILAQLDAPERKLVNLRVREGLAAIERGEYTDYVGRDGLDQLAASVKTAGRKHLARTNSSK